MHPVEVLLLPVGWALRSRRPDESASLAHAPELRTGNQFTLTSPSFGDGEVIPRGTAASSSAPTSRPRSPGARFRRAPSGWSCCSRTSTTRPPSPASTRSPRSPRPRAGCPRAPSARTTRPCSSSASPAATPATSARDRSPATDRTATGSTSTRSTPTSTSPKLVTLSSCRRPWPGTSSRPAPSPAPEPPERGRRRCRR